MSSWRTPTSHGSPTQVRQLERPSGTLKSTCFAPAEPEVSPSVAAPGLLNGSASSSSGSAPTPTSNGSEEWGTSFAGLGERSFTRMPSTCSWPRQRDRRRDQANGGVIYLPEIKYRRILNKAFGRAGWVWLLVARPTWAKASSAENGSHLARDASSPRREASRSSFIKPSGRAYRLGRCQVEMR